MLATAPVYGSNSRCRPKAAAQAYEVDRPRAVVERYKGLGTGNDFDFGPSE